VGFIPRTKRTVRRKSKIKENERRKEGRKGGNKS
jgi:hypothetical protein